MGSWRSWERDTMALYRPGVRVPSTPPDGELRFSIFFGEIMGKLFLLIFFIYIFTLGFSVELIFTEENILDEIIHLISSSEKSIYLASYSIDCKDVVESLNYLNERGIEIEVLIDDNSISRAFSAGINFDIASDNSSYLQHAKFIIIDEKIVIVGTGNFTNGGLIEDSNSFLIFRDEKIAKIFLEIFSNIKNDNSNILYRERGFNFFLLPSEEAKDIILKNVLRSKKSIYFMIYAFTDEDFMAAFKIAQSSGVEIRGIVDDWNYDSKLIEFFDDKIIINNNEWLVHDKTIIIDEKYIITGSPNFSKNGWLKNNEVELFFESEVMAKKYINHFNYIVGEIYGEK